MLARAGFGDYAPGTKPLGEDRLADRVIDLVRAGVRKVFALQPDVGAPAFAEPRRKGQCRRAADPLAQFFMKFLLERLFVQVLLNAFLEPLERRHQRFRYVAAAKRAEATALVRQLAAYRGFEQGRRFVSLQ